MNERTRKIIVFSLSGLALTWAAMNTGGHKSPPPKPVPAQQPKPQQVLPSADKVVVNIAKKEQEPWGRDPFQQPKHHRATATVPAMEWICSGIMYKAGSPSAFINGQAVQAGDTVDGAKVIAITRRAVKLEHNGKRFTLEISRG